MKAVNDKKTGNVRTRNELGTENYGKNRKKGSELKSQLQIVCPKIKREINWKISSKREINRKRDLSKR